MDKEKRILCVYIFCFSGLFFYLYLSACNLDERNMSYLMTVPPVRQIFCVEGFFFFNLTFESFSHRPIGYLVLVHCVLVTEVPNQPDEVGLEADDGGVGGPVAFGAVILRSTEDVLAGLPNGVHLLQ